MKEIKLDVQVRNDFGSKVIRRMRREKSLPGIVYGGGKKTTPIKMDLRAFQKIRRQHHGEVVFHINVMEGSKKLSDSAAIVKEEQHDPVTDDILHIDFKRISLKEKIEVKAPIVAKGEAVGVKTGGGSLEHIIWELNIVCLPTDIPEEITVDVNDMEIGDSVYVKDLELPEGVKTTNDPEAIVLSVVPPMKEEEIITEPTDEEAEPELIKAEKKEKDEEAEEPEAPEKKAEEAKGGKEE